MTHIFLHVFSAYFAPHPPVADQSWKALLLSVGASLAWLADQNHPLMFLGKKSGLSHPSKSHRRPEVQKYGTFTENKTMMTANLFDKSQKVTIDESLDPVVLLLSLEADQVHAPLPAVVPGIEPVPLGVPHTAVIILPGEPVQVPVEPLHTALVNS